LAITLAFFLVSFPCAGFWLLGGAGLSRVLKNPHAHRLFNVAMGLLLAVSVVPPLIELWQFYF